MKIAEIRSLTINSVVANKLNHYKIVAINKEDDKIVSFELKPMYAQLWTDPQNKTIKINSMRNYNLIELAEEPQEIEEPQVIEEPKQDNYEFIAMDVEVNKGHHMKKIQEDLYTYKGINITKDHRGYHCSILTEKCKLPIRIDSPTQQGLKNILNRTIREYGIIKDG